MVLPRRGLLMHFEDCHRTPFTSRLLPNLMWSRRSVALWFDPGALYTSRNHPRGLQMSVYAMSDALADLGLGWDQLTAGLSPDAVSVYVSSSMGQLDEAATGGRAQPHCAASGY